MSRAPVLSVEGLSTTFETPQGVLTAVRDVSLTLNRGEILGLVGESGSGKTVTGFSIMRLIDEPGRVAGGRVMFDGQDLLSISEEQMRQLRGARIAMIFQDPMMTLNPVLSVGRQMCEVLETHKGMKTADARSIARDQLGLVGIPSPDERLNAYPHQLSGGMRQRVAIAIALLCDPDLIIADEPTTALDVTIQGQILFEIQKLVERSGTALIWITHDLSVVASIADTIAVMYAGRIVERGLTDDVIQNPGHPYTAGLIRSVPGRVAPGDDLMPIPGSAPGLAMIPEGCAFRPRCDRALQACAAPVDEQSFSNRRALACIRPLI